MTEEEEMNTDKYGISPQAYESIKKKKTERLERLRLNRRLKDCAKYVVYPKCGGDSEDHDSRFYSTEVTYCKKCDLAVYSPYGSGDIEIISGKEYRTDKEASDKAWEEIRNDMDKENSKI